ncbi:cytochrome P450, partial [Conidiobolus coronatus NRRL 28638]
RDLKYLEAAILESMRMHPAVAGSLPRQVPEDGLTVNSHYIPPKTSITIDIYTEHNDPSFWKNPREFNLHRWLGEDRETNRAKLAGFGLGTRACVGRDLAWSELFLVIANLIRNFNFELVD